MRKRFIAIVLVIVCLFSISPVALACNESQTDTYVLQILFGDSALSRESDENAKMLLAALYLCSEQSDGLGQDKLDYLKNHKVGKIPALNTINLKENSLLECEHNTWAYIYTPQKDAQSNRKKLLQRTVNKVFDFGLFNNWFSGTSGKCDSFAALLCYSHILSDYLVNDPAETEVTVKGKSVSAFSGQAYVELNGNRPGFTTQQKTNTTAFATYSSLDRLGRAGVAFVNVCPEIMPPSNSRQNIGMIQPSGWNQNRYPGIVNSDPPYIYNRCHLVGHQLAGEDGEINLITGTRYLNATGMLPFENAVADYVRNTGNHVLYRATPIYKGENKIASGVQLEAYSVEDAGKGICFNVYCYNIQPGVELNYATGTNSLADVTFEAKNVLPFAVMNPSDANPDLIYEMTKQLELLFVDQKNSSTYISMMDQIKAIGNDARVVGNKNEAPAQCYIQLKEYEYKFFEVLKNYVPLLLAKEDFFKSTFK